MRPASLLALVVVVPSVIAAVACSSGEDESARAPAAECRSGERLACACSSGPEGFRSCLASGRFGECQCANVPPGQSEIDSGCPTVRAYVDGDGDGFGTGELVAVCAGDESGAPPPGYASRPGDCDDADARAFPGQTVPQAGTRKGAGGGDFDCDGTETKLYGQKGICVASAGCQGSTGWDDEVAPCGATEGFVIECKVENGACITVTAGRTQTCL